MSFCRTAITSSGAALGMPHERPPSSAIKLFLLRLVIFLIAFGSSTLYGQNSDTRKINNWTLDGTVRNSAGEPLGDADVIVMAGHHYTTRTDAKGHYQVTGNVGGRYGTYAKKTGYVSAQIAMIEMTPGTAYELDLRLERQGVIIGRVVFEGGEPISGAEVVAWLRAFHNGIPRVTPRGSSKSDASGNFRIDGLERRPYYIGVVPPHLQSSTVGQNPQRAYSPAVTLYPQAQSLENATQVSPTEREKRGLNIVIPRAKTACIDGSISPMSAVDASGATLTLTQLMTGFDYVIRTTEAQPGKSFRLCGLVPGIDYRLTATTWDRTGKALGLAKDRFSISGREAETGVVNLGQLVVTGSRSIAGTIRIASDSLNAQPCPSQILLAFDITAPALMGESIMANPDSSCHFVFPTLFAHEYRLQILGLPPALYVKSATCGQHNVLDEEWLPDCDYINVELERGGASVSGAVVDTEGKKVSDAEAILVSEMGAARIMAEPVNADGTFRFSALSPGNYRVVAVSGIADDDASNPDVAGKYSNHAIELTLRAEENRGMTLTVVKPD